MSTNLRLYTPPRVLTVAGSDSSGSAGLQADLKTFEACGVFGMTALTIITAQNTLGVQHATSLDEIMIHKQIVAVLDDIGTDAIKTGILGRASVIELVAEVIQTYQIHQAVIDPVLVNGKGQQFVDDEAVQAYRKHLFPLATVITPNIDEAAILANMPIQTLDDIHQAAAKLHGYGVSYVVIKGGHLANPKTVTNYIFDGEAITELIAPRLPIENPHGVGCTFASATAAHLAKEQHPLHAIRAAHNYLQAALEGSITWKLGKGRLPVNHHYQP